MVFDTTTVAQKGEVKCPECGRVVPVGALARAHATIHWGTNPNLATGKLRGEAAERYRTLVEAK